MSLFADLYTAGAEGGGTNGSIVSATQARAAVRETDRTAGRLHRDIERYARPSFARFWHEWYNGWVQYRELQSEKDIARDPRQVVETEMSRVARRLDEWRAALTQDTGGRSPAVNATPAGQRGFPWRPVLVIGGMSLAALLTHLWWQDREQRLRGDAERHAQRQQQLLAFTGGGPMQPYGYAPTPPAAAPVIINNIPPYGAAYGG